jgi:hypothetical protein
MSEALSASRMTCLLTCPRQYFYKYELGIERLEKPKALVFGAVWAKFKELYRLNVPLDDAMHQAIASQKDTTNLDTPVFVAMATAYDTCYGNRGVYSHIYPEVEFDRPMTELPGDFRAFGRLDAICVTKAGEHVINEDKTTSVDISPSAPYWDGTLFNVQVLYYVAEVRRLGWNVRRVVYEVSRKPKTERKTIPELDDNGLKIVICDATHERAMNKNGTPRQIAGDGFTFQGRMETDGEYATRLKGDILSDPVKWFAQRDIWVKDAALAEFEGHKAACVRLILSSREAATGMPDPALAWPRNVDSQRCRNKCEYCGFCLQGWSTRPEELPEGYAFTKRNHGTEPEGVRPN